MFEQSPEIIAAVYFKSRLKILFVLKFKLSVQSLDRSVRQEILN